MLNTCKSTEKPPKPKIKAQIIILIFILKKLLKHIYDVVYKDERNNIKSKLVGVYFNPKWNKEYDSTYLGLEITDRFFKY